MTSNKNGWTQDRSLREKNITDEGQRVLNTSFPGGERLGSVLIRSKLGSGFAQQSKEVSQFTMNIPKDEKIALYMSLFYSLRGKSLR